MMLQIVLGVRCSERGCPSRHLRRSAKLQTSCFATKADAVAMNLGDWIARELGLQFVPDHEFGIGIGNVGRV